MLYRFCDCSFAAAQGGIGPRSQLRHWRRLSRGLRRPAGNVEFASAESLGLEADGGLANVVRLRLFVHLPVARKRTSHLRARPSARVLFSECRERISQRSVWNLHQAAEWMIEVEDKKHGSRDREGAD